MSKEWEDNPLEWCNPMVEELRPSWWERRRKRKQCFHHDLGSATGTLPPESWIKSQLIDIGKRKMFWCDERLGGCGKTWFV